MKEVIKLAAKGQGKTFPNPLVGCLIVKDDKVISRGHHKKIGSAHAERDAIDSYEDKNGALPEGCDLYVNLEPCSHHGKTAPCSDYIILKKFKRVYIGMQDPNPLVLGEGIKKMLSAGIEVYQNILTEECELLNQVFIKNMIKGEAYFSLKVATTFDGHMADQFGVSKWITCNKSREFVHQLRSRYDALLVGIGTVKTDNPSLNIRMKGKELNNKVIIIDKNFEIDINAKLFLKNSFRNVLIITTCEKLSQQRQKRDDLENRGVKIITQKLECGNFKSDLGKKLFELGYFNILIEAGPSLISSFIKNNMIDDLHRFMAPIVIGSANPHKHFLEGLNINALESKKQLKIIEHKIIDDDIYIYLKFKHV